MQSVAVSRNYDVSPTRLCEAIRDVEPFIRASGFDRVEVDGSTVVVANRVGILEIELKLRLVDDDDVALAYEQFEGIFETMRTSYSITQFGAGSEVTAVTEFAVAIDLVGGLLDTAVISGQRRRELNAQFEYLENWVESDLAGTCSGS